MINNSNKSRCAHDLSIKRVKTRIWNVKLSLHEYTYYFLNILLKTYNVTRSSSSQSRRLHRYVLITRRFYHFIISFIKWSESDDEWLRLNLGSEKEVAVAYMKWKMEQQQQPDDDSKTLNRCLLSIEIEMLEIEEIKKFKQVHFLISV